MSPMNFRPFQIILIGIFAALAIGGVIFFAIFRGFGGTPNPYGAGVQIWGTLDRSAFASVMSAIGDSDHDFKVASYIQKDPRTFKDELVNAIAEGRGPDAIVLSSDALVSERAKLYPIPYTTLPLRTIKDTYVDGAEIFALSDGMYGFPFAVDPLVMYWNRDLFATAGLATPPATWEQMVSQTVPTLVKMKASPAFAIDKGALDFGEYANVQNVEEIVLMLLLQAGSPLVTENANGYTDAINQSDNQASGQIGRPPAEATLDFYTQFANPSRPVYTWNRSLPGDRSAFLAGDLAVYFGFGSEYAGLRAGNPNLNFDVASVPQGSGVSIKKSYGTFYALSILRSNKNFAGTYRALTKLADGSRASALAITLGFAPVHRAMLALGNPDPFRQTMYTMALIARGFLDPDPAKSADIIKTMIEDVTSGRSDVSRAVGDAVGRFNQLLR